MAESTIEERIRRTSDQAVAKSIARQVQQPARNRVALNHIDSQEYIARKSDQAFNPAREKRHGTPLNQKRSAHWRAATPQKCIELNKELQAQTEAALENVLLRLMPPYQKDTPLTCKRPPYSSSPKPPLTS